MSTSGFQFVPVWQLLVGGQWRNVDKHSAETLEATLTSTAKQTHWMQNVKVWDPKFLLEVTLGTGQGRDGTGGDLDIDNMVFAGMPLRRSRKLEDIPDTTMKIFYWNEDRWWAPLDTYASSLVVAALKAKRTKTAFYVNGVGYDVMIRASSPILGSGFDAVQVNRASGRGRPLLITGRLTSDDDLTDLDDGVELEDDDDIPNEFKCPISMMPMKHPVVLADGHTYDRQSIRRWLAKKQTSPNTGEQLKHTKLLPNRTLKKIMMDFASSRSCASKFPDRLVGINKKKMRLGKDPAFFTTEP